MAAGTQNRTDYAAVLSALATFKAGATQANATGTPAEKQTTVEDIKRAAGELDTVLTRIKFNVQGL